MKKLAVIVLAVSIGIPAAFAGQSAAGSPLPAAPNVITQHGVGEAFLFPVAGSVEGVNGTHFRSEVSLVNFKHEPQELLVEFLPQNATQPTTIRLTIDARRFEFWNDFVATMMSRPGTLGALTFRAVMPGTTVTDTTAQLNAFSRIWTPQPGTNGTSSMSMSAIDATGLSAIGNEAAYVIGHRQDAQYRVNVGIVNLASVDRVFLVEPTNSFPTNPAPSFSVTVPARSMQQVAMPEGFFAALVFRITPATAGAWTAYAATVDNFSGDGWISKAQYSTRR
ncbi:MAG TPA: hypothetical protein VNA04_12825 [Thermoanaerobaculia bacterium]|nr:hypothetical protein [Thermoanaerobaculia bacterium]